MEKKMETAIMGLGPIRVLEYRGDIGILPHKMETTIMGLRY